MAVEPGLEEGPQKRLGPGAGHGVPPSWGAFFRRTCCPERVSVRGYRFDFVDRWGPYLDDGPSVVVHQLEHRFKVGAAEASFADSAVFVVLGATHFAFQIKARIAAQWGRGQAGTKYEFVCLFLGMCA